MENNGQKLFASPMMQTMLSLIVSAVVAGIGVGVQQQRINSLDEQMKAITTDLREYETRLGAHDTQLAVTRERLDQILIKLGEIEKSVQHVEEQRFSAKP